MPKGSVAIGFERFAWVVVNVTDLERSRAFYEAMTPLRVHARIEAREQRFNGLGIESGSFDGYLLRDEVAGDRVSVQLVQWHRPSPTGNTYRSHTNPGYFRICFGSPDVTGLYNSVIAAGYETLSPLRPPHGQHQKGRPVFSFRDPDGTVLEYVTLPGEYHLHHTNCNVSDLDQAHAFYQDVLGLHRESHWFTTVPESHSFGPGGDLMTYRANLYSTAGGSPEQPPNFLLDVVQSTFPGPIGRVYAEPTNVGIARVGLEVRSVDAAYEALQATDASVIVAAPERWDLGADVGSVKSLIVRSPDGAPVELIERQSSDSSTVS